MESIYDGIQRPLKAIRAMSDSIYIPRGIATDALDRQKAWEFSPSSNLRVGDMSPVGTYLVQHSRILLFPNTTSSFLLVREGRLVISLRREIIKSMKRSWRLNLMAK